MNSTRKKQLKELQKIIKIDCDIELLDIALTHSSYCAENDYPYEECNERLEFLGDAVLKLTISEYLYKKFPDYHEGDLSAIRSAVVSDATLEKISYNINLAEYITLGSGEEKNGGRKRGSTIACAFEAILGALYLDGKFKEAKKLIENLLDDEIIKIDTDSSKNNYKAVLQEYFQGKYNSLPEYILTKQEGPPHNKTFYTDVIFREEYLASGMGNTKKAAQKEAARLACIKLGLIEGEQSE